MRNLLHYLSVVLVSLCSIGGLLGQTSYEITLKSGPIAAHDMATLAEATPAFLSPTQFDGNFILALQFNDILTQKQQASLVQSGVELMGYLPNYAFIAKVPVNFNFASLTRYNLRKVVRLRGIHKLDRNLANGNYPDYALNSGNQIDLKVMPYPSTPTSRLKSLLQNEEIQLLSSIQPESYLAVRVDLNEINKLADLAYIMYLEPVEPTPVPDGMRGRTLHRANTLSQQPGTGYDGTGVTVADADDGGLSHIDFHGRLTDHTSAQGGTHGDMTAGIISGAGNLDPTKMGMGTGAYLHMYDIGGYPQVTNALANFTNLGTVITSTSYSEVCGGEYTTTARNLDADAYTQKELLHVFSAGNSASSTCSNVYGSITVPTGNRYGNITGGRKAAKNSIATANLEFNDDRTASSSRGPAEDGRLKPDISANGTSQQSTAPNNGYAPGGGTSAACPGIAGISSMLYQAYKDLNGVSNPQGSKIKGILLNSAYDLGRPGPDYDFGWGRVNARRALEVIENGQHGDSIISTSQTRTHTIVVPAGLSQVKVMVNWLDPAGTVTAAKALVNDLDMTLIAPNGTVYNPWTLSTFPNIDSIQRNAQRGIDDVNNMEQVTLDLPTAGTYTLTVSGTAVPTGPQDYHFSYVSCSK